MKWWWIARTKQQTPSFPIVSSRRRGSEPVTSSSFTEVTKVVDIVVFSRLLLQDYQNAEKHTHTGNNHVNAKDGFSLLLLNWHLSSSRCANTSSCCDQLVESQGAHQLNYIVSESDQAYEAFCCQTNIYIYIYIYT